jgi:hypothetical protein
MLLLLLLLLLLLCGLVRIYDLDIVVLSHFVFCHMRVFSLCNRLSCLLIYCTAILNFIFSVIHTLNRIFAIVYSKYF